MYEISNQLYLEVARQLLSRFGRHDYLSQRVEFNFGEVECSLLLTCIIHRRNALFPEGKMQTIEDVVPVWWEFHTFIDGEEVLNDFSFNSLREYLKEQL